MQILLYEETEYVVDISKVESGEEANLNISLFLPPDSMPDKWPELADSANRILVSHYNEKEMVLKVYDFKLKQYIFSESHAIGTGHPKRYSFFPELDKYILKENGYHLVEVVSGEQKRIENIDTIDFGNIVYSPDENYFAYVVNKEGINYITIYSLDLMKQTSSIPIGEEPLYLSDWGSDNRIYYNYGLNGYSIGIDGSNKLDLGKFVFYPLVSPDGKYLAYSRPDTFNHIDDLGEIEEYSTFERGVFLVDMASKKTIHLAPYVDGASTIPIHFFTDRLQID